MFLSSIPRAPGIDDYVPRDTRQREDAYHAWAGWAAEAWPVPLTACGSSPDPTYPPAPAGG